MSRVPNRAYSFDDNDELSLSAHRQVQHADYPQRYQDSPPRDTQASSAPRYAAYVPEDHSGQPANQYSYQQQPYAPTSHQAYQSSAFPAQTAYQGRGPSFPEPQNEPRDPRDLGYTTSMQTASTTTPGIDNLGATAAGGGIADIAIGRRHSLPESSHSDPFASRLAQALFFADDRAAWNSDDPLLMWDRRTAEPIIAHTNEFYRPRPLALLDFEPRSTPLSTLTDLEQKYLAAMLRTIFFNPAQSLADALNGMTPSAADALIPQCPSLHDPLRGGRRAVDQLRVRVLTLEMIRELTIALENWKFSPTVAEISRNSPFSWLKEL